MTAAWPAPGRDNAVKTWGTDGAAHKSYPAFNESALRCAFSHDGQRVIGGDWLGNIRVWDAAKAAELFPLTANPPTLAMRLEIAKKELAAQEALWPPPLSLSAAAEKLVAEREAQLKAASADLRQRAKLPQKHGPPWRKPKPPCKQQWPTNKLFNKPPT